MKFKKQIVFFYLLLIFGCNNSGIVDDNFNDNNDSFSEQEIIFNEMISKNQSSDIIEIINEEDIS